MFIDRITDMYKLEPIVIIKDKIPLPTCMYKVKNIHGGTIFSDISASDSIEVKNSEINQQKPLKEMAMIEARQEKLVEQLEKLRNQMTSMKHFLISSPQPKLGKPVTKVSKPQFPNTLPRDVVIKASPKYLPYYLLSLQKILGFKITCHSHSSVTCLPEPAKQFMVSAELNNSTSPEMKITLIFKEVGVSTQLVTSPTMPVVILGDVNILRYLVAAVPSNLNYKEFSSSWEIDSLLDICHRLQSHKSIKERQSLVGLLNSKLGKNSWLNGNSSVSIADVAAWSVIKQGDYQKDLTANMKTWVKRCEDCNSLCLIK